MNKYIMSYKNKVIDLTHTLNPEIPTWDGSCGFTIDTLVDHHECQGPYTFKAQKFTLLASAGTHIDSPAHVFTHGATTDQIHVDNLIALAVMIDARSKVTSSYVVSEQDIIEWEYIHGTIPDQAIVCICTGWDVRWSDKDLYRNNHQFPSISAQAAQLLSTRNIKGIIVDTLSPDRPDNGYPVHHIFLEKSIFIVENATNLHYIPPCQSQVVVAPLLIEGATESPVRLLALVPE